MAPENFKENKQESSGDKEQAGFTRREFLKTLGLAAGGVLCSGLEKAVAQEASTPSRYEKHGWFYTLEEIKEVYEREYNGEKILKNVFKKKGEEWIGTMNGKEFVVPQEFVEKTLSLLGELLEKKLAKYIFRLDCSHGHFFVDEKHRDSFYANCDSLEEARRLAEDKKLGILFHNNEHLKKDPNDKEVMNFIEKRNVIGWYDGREMEILPLPQGKSIAISTPGRDFASYPKFAAHKDGVFSITVDGKEIRLDISFDDNSYY